MRWWVIAVGLGIAGCGGAWVPSVAVRAEIRRVSVSAWSGATGNESTREGWEHGASVAVWWGAYDEAAAPVPAAVLLPAPPQWSHRCASATLCAWERRERSRALRALRRRLEWDGG
jgi:hypothetical protein